MKYSLEVDIKEICYNLVDTKGNVIAKGHNVIQLKELAMKLEGMQTTANIVNEQLKAYRSIRDIFKP